MKVLRVSKSRTGADIRIYGLSERAYLERSDAMQGICLGCGSQADGVEPDARKYLCEDCGAERVYGIEEALMMGRIEITGGRRERLRD